MANISSAESRPTLGQSSSLFSRIKNFDSGLVRCDIVFGMPSQDCRSTGICKLNSDYNALHSPKNDCRNTVAFAGKSGHGNRIILVFFRELLCAQLYSRHFRKGVLEMKEPCPLPEQLVADLGINGTSLLAGTYRIQESEGCFRVEVDCGV